MQSEDELSSRLLLSLLEEFFSKAHIVLPRYVKAIDIGAGKWHYAEPLYNFLSTYHGNRTVELRGIDTKEDTMQQNKSKNGPIAFSKADVFSIKAKNAFHMAFLIHMFPEYHFREHNIPFRPYKELFAKIFELLKPEGILVAIAYGSPEDEYSFFDEVPKESVLYRGRYLSEEATRIDYFLGKDTFHNNMVLIARK
jgi:SAM-dependent methyltransferase